MSTTYELITHSIHIYPIGTRPDHKEDSKDPLCLSIPFARKNLSKMVFWNALFLTKYGTFSY